MLAPNATEAISFELPPITTNGTHTVATNVTMVNENANQLEGLNMPTLELTITDGTDPDNVKAIKNPNNMIDDPRVYDLQGRKIISPTKGVYIINGKKVLVK